ncbi:MAG: alanine--tRNA ligase [Candidatus Moranbacteria bacterium]|nr:alanine--tRNA ligase [Candidatus Moranbacteria bacterium]
MLTAKDLRQKYLDFFKSKGHAIIPSAPLVPENDPTTLFINSGMHPLVPYLMGEKHPLGKRLVDAQKCIRTGDIDEVGDTTHHTFFEMLGNWSLGDYFKKEALEWSWEFLTSEEWLGLDKKRLASSVFEGDTDASFDEEAHSVWLNIGMPEKKIAKLPKKNNWWGPAGVTGPCGPDSEMFYWVGDLDKVPDSFNDDNDLWVEIWNDVFMEFNKNEKGEYGKLAAQNVDTGMGLERVLAALNGFDDNYRTELFWPIIEKVEELSGKKYDESKDVKRAMRIIADHIKASVFIIADGVEPSNTERGYVLRRLIRRAITQGHILSIKNNFTIEIAKVIQGMYGEAYLEVLSGKVLNVLEEEENKFRKTMEQGLKILEGKKRITGKEAFDLFQTYGFPIELTREFIEGIDHTLTLEEKVEISDDFSEELKKHQELSRTASAGMFKGGLSDTKEKTTELHTVAHLMLAGLRKVLGENVHQKGSNINGERIRFDFSHPDKMTDEQKKAVEDFVNEAIESKTEVLMAEMTPDEAKNIGAEGEFGHKYGERVKVYSIGEYSREICGGPHIKNTSEIQGKFRIQKEESSSAGVRRIKAVVE